MEQGDSNPEINEPSSYHDVLAMFDDRPWIKWQDPREKEFENDSEAIAYIKEYLDAAKQYSYFAVQMFESEPSDTLKHGKSQTEWRQEYESAENQLDALNVIRGMGPSQRYFE
jgi:hypothetical protein